MALKGGQKAKWAWVSPEAKSAEKMSMKKLTPRLARGIKHRATQEATAQPAIQPAKLSTNQPTNQQTNKPSSQPNSQPASQPPASQPPARRPTARACPYVHFGTHQAMLRRAPIRLLPRFLGLRATQTNCRPSST